MLVFTSDAHVESAKGTVSLDQSGAINAKRQAGHKSPPKIYPGVEKFCFNKVLNEKPGDPSS